MNNKKNYVSAIVLQMVAILQGLILPRLMINTFGSEVYGLISSITQFLSFITLLEGGLGAVVLAELYGPLAAGDDESVRKILRACQDFFNKLALCFILYTAVLSVAYPLLSGKSFSFGYVCSLIWILSASTIAQYLFSITNRLFLQANQSIFLVNLISAAVIVFNLIIAVVMIHVFPEIHLMKLISSLIFLSQPIAYNKLVDKKYRIKFGKKCKTPLHILKNRWSGFAQNFAHFVNMNTDIVLITIFVGLKEVSVYSVYLLAINALRNLVTNVANSYQGALGKYNAEHNIEKLKKKFNEFEKIFLIIGVALFSTCLLLINPFVKIYTKNINDANYYQPFFAMIIVLANMVYCVREPYRSLIYAAGKFSETNTGSILEAVINLVISLALLPRLGLVGVAIGTLCAMMYRLVYFILFLKDNIIMKAIKEYVVDYGWAFVLIIANIWIYLKVNFAIETIWSFIIHGILIVICELLVAVLLIERENLLVLMKK
jgi:hypothetical protein